MRVALLTGPSGSGKTFVADQLRKQFDCVSYDGLMRDSIDQAFPDYPGDKWNKQIWLDNGHRINLPAALERAFTASGRRPLLVEGWQLRESLWRDVILSLAVSRAQSPITAKLFVIRPTPELLLSQRAASVHHYHRRHATAVDCQRQITIHETLYREQPWRGELVQLETTAESCEAVHAFLSGT